MQNEQYVSVFNLFLLSGPQQFLNELYLKNQNGCMAYEDYYGPFRGPLRLEGRIARLMALHAATVARNIKNSNFSMKLSLLLKIWKVTRAAVTFLAAACLRSLIAEELNSNPMAGQKS